MEFSRILIVRLSAIGDVIHTLPALECIRKSFPKAYIGWAVEDFASAFLLGHPALDTLHVIPKRKWRGNFWRHLGPEIRPFFREMRSKRYDVAIDFQGLTKSGAVAWLSGAPVRIGFGDAQGAELNKILTNLRIRPPTEAVHIIQRNMALLQGLGIHSDKLTPTRPSITFSSEETREGLQLAGTDSAIGLNVGAGWETKRWPAKHWATLARLIHAELGHEMILLWGNETEKQIAVEALNHANLPASALRLSPPTTVRISGALIRQLQAYVGLDTGATHMAAALGIPTIAIHGASDARRNGPFWTNSIVLQSDSAQCIPCWKRDCRAERHLACLEDVTAEWVFDSLLALLNRNRKESEQADQA